MMHETKLQALRDDIEGDVVMHLSDDGRGALEGWVGSFEGHQRALEIARDLPGVRSVDDRLMIVLGRLPER
jgi:osmotically-inducible protein OsmY